MEVQEVEEENIQEGGENPQINIEPENPQDIQDELLEFLDVAEVPILTPKPINLLITAIEAQNVSEVKEILQNFLIVSTKNSKEPSDPEIMLQINEKVGLTTPVELAWTKRNFDIIHLLLEANAEFPFSYSILTDEIELPASLKTFIKTMNNFHRLVHEENIEELSEIIDQNPRLKHFYNLGCVSAVMHALRTNKFEVFEFLTSKNLEIGLKEDFYENLHQKQKNAIKSYKIDFQGHKIELEKILSDNLSGILTTSHIIEMLRNKKLVIGEEIKLDFHAYNRGILNEFSSYKNAFDTYHKTMVISDFPKTGRTTTAKQTVIELKKIYVERWVIYVDLKTWWRREFEHFDDLKKVFCKNDLEEAIFMKAYAEDKVVFMWDGADELKGEEFERFLGEFLN